jgi:hypothetical protein
MGKLDECLTVAEHDERAMTRSLWVPRRRVPVQVQLADGSLLSGELYADVKSIDGMPGRVLDRLNESQETFLPLASDDKHILLKKSGIATVRLDAGEEEFRGGAAEGTREVRARISLSDGTHLEGMIPAPLSPRARLLDYLNASREKFSVLRNDRQVTLINSACVLAVTELRDPE